MQRWIRVAAVAGLATVMGTAAFAQNEQPRGEGRGRGGPGGGGPGFGGFGMMGGRGGAQWNILALAGQETVQADLGATDAQKEKLKKFSEESVAGLREAVGGGGGFGGGGGRPDPNATQEERDKAAAERAKSAAERAEKTAKFVAEKRPALAEIVSAEQVKRLDEIALRAKGPDALLDAEVAGKLMLTADQKTKLASVAKDHGDKAMQAFRDLRQGGGGGGGGGGFSPEAMAKMAEKNKELNDAKEKDLIAVLTPVQAEQFDLMKGKDFDITKLRMNFGGGRGPGGPGGPGGGGTGGGRPTRPAAET